MQVARFYDHSELEGNDIPARYIHMSLVACVLYPLIRTLGTKYKIRRNLGEDFI
jgi:hypothetical protein